MFPLLHQNNSRSVSLRTTSLLTSFSLLGLSVFFLGTSVVKAQPPADQSSEPKTIRLNVEVEEDGNTTRLDTVMILDGQQDLSAILKALGLDADISEYGDGEDIEIIINKRMALDDEMEGLKLELNELIPDLTELQDMLRDVQHRVMVYEAEAQPDRAFLGIYYDPEQSDKGAGIRVTGIVPQSGAEAAGLQKDDLILGLGGKSFNEEFGLLEALQNHTAGDEVKIKIKRDGKTSQVRAILGKPVSGNEFHWQGDDESYEFHWDGGDMDLGDMRFFADPESLAEWTPKPFLGVLLDYSDANGVVISGTVEGTTAEAMGLQKGDIITAINGLPVNDITGLKEHIKALTIDETVQVDYLRDNQAASAEAPLIPHHEAGKAVMWQEGLSGALRNVERIIEERVLSDEGNVSEELLRDLENLRSQHNLNLFLAEEPLDNADTRVVRRVSVFITMDNLSVDERAQLNEKANPPIPAEDNLAVGDVFFSPNPSDGRFRLHVELEDAGLATVRMFDASGREVYQSEFADTPGTFDEAIDISEEPKGVYYLAVEQNGRAYTKKVAIQ